MKAAINLISPNKNKIKIEVNKIMNYESSMSQLKRDESLQT